MGVTIADRKYPWPVHANGKEIRSLSTYQLLAETATHTEVTIDSFVKPSAGNWIATASADVLTGAQIRSLYNENGIELPYQHVTKADLEATDHYFEALPVGGIIWEGTEDGVGNFLAQADMNKYGLLAVAAITTTNKEINPRGVGLANILLKSSTFLGAQTLSGVMIQVLAVSGSLDNDVAGTIRNYQFKFIDNLGISGATHWL